MAYYKFYNRKKLFLFLILVLFILGLVFLSFILYPIPAASKLKTGVLNINGQPIKIEIASSDSDQYRGLSNRAGLCADCGMLFNFSDYDKRAFVMRDMKFPLDIIFIKDNHIINIAANLAPEGSDTKNIYYSGVEVNRVLEVNGGYCEKYGIKAGDLVSDVNIN